MSEQAVRRLRAIVFTKDCEDFSWNVVKGYWMQPANLEWLKQRVLKPLADYSKDKVFTV